jgi:hypothetical protein
MDSNAILYSHPSLSENSRRSIKGMAFVEAKRVIHGPKRLKLLEKLWNRFLTSLGTRTTYSWHLHTVFSDQVESGIYVRLNEVTGSDI